MSQSTLTIGDKENADITLLWFHGYGANNWSFEPFIKLLNLNLDGRIYVVMPNAPVDNNKRSWYPLPTEVDGKIVENDAGIDKAKAETLSDLSEYLKDCKRLYIGGFSQGAAFSLSLGLNHDISCEGIIAISGYIPSASSIKINGASKSIYIAHGASDTTISLDTHKKSIQYLDKNNVDYTEFVDDCGHTISKAIISDLTDWLLKKL